MKITVTINCDSAAFEESASAETARVLRELADKVALADLNEPFDRKLFVLDSNGNKVGFLEVSGFLEG